MELAGTESRGRTGLHLQLSPKILPPPLSPTRVEGFTTHTGNKDLGLQSALISVHHQLPVAGMGGETTVPLRQGWYYLLLLFQHRNVRRNKTSGQRSRIGSAVSSNPTAIRGGANFASLLSKTPTTPKRKHPKTLLERLYNIPQPVRFAISGALATVVLYSFHQSLLKIFTNILPESSTPETASFFVAYMLHILIQHILHASLVYGMSTIDTRDKYLSTLWAMYQTLMVSAVGSSLCNAYLMKQNVNSNAAFLLTLVIFSIVNYLWISSSMKKNQDRAIH